MSYDVDERYNLPSFHVRTIQHLGPRSEQQDAFAFLVGDGSAPFAVLADGAGGHDGGREAALAAVNACCMEFPSTAELDSALAQAMLGLRWAYPQATTTVVAAQFFVRARRLRVWWVGDSRAYAIRSVKGKSCLTPLTADDNLAWSRWAERRRTRPDAMYDFEDNNILTASASADRNQHSKLRFVEIAYSDIIGVVLMSDGAYDALHLPALLPGFGISAPVLPFEDQPCVPWDLEKLCMAPLTDNASAIVLWVPA